MNTLWRVFIAPILVRLKTFIANNLLATRLHSYFDGTDFGDSGVGTSHSEAESVSHADTSYTDRNKAQLVDDEWTIRQLLYRVPCFQMPFDRCPAIRCSPNSRRIKVLVNILLFYYFIFVNILFNHFPILLIGLPFIAYKMSLAKFGLFKYIFYCRTIRPGWLNFESAFSSGFVCNRLSWAQSGNLIA